MTHKIHVHIVTPSSNYNVSINLRGELLCLKFDSTYRKLELEFAGPFTAKCDKGDWKEWNASTTANCLLFYDVFTHYIVP